MATLFGRYELLDRICVGEMAEVFRGRVLGEAGFEKIVALKRMLPELTDDPEFIRMFIDEAKVSASLNHANIGQVFEFGRIENRYFIAMEYVSGRNVRELQEYFQAKGELMPIAMALRIVLEVCHALEYAHSKRDSAGRPLHIVHRDVNPQNILVSYDGAVKLIDFGIAKALSRTQISRVGRAKDTCGYLSPEQVAGAPVDGRSDLFALAVILWELVVGQPLFRAEEEHVILERVRHAKVPAPSSRNRAIPKGLEQIILKTLARGPESRFQNAAQLNEALERFMLTQRLTFSEKQLSDWMRVTFGGEKTPPPVALASDDDVPTAAGEKKLAPVALASDFDDVPTSPHVPPTRSVRRTLRGFSVSSPREAALVGEARRPAAAPKPLSALGPLGEEVLEETVLSAESAQLAVSMARGALRPEPALPTTGGALLLPELPDDGPTLLDPNAAEKVEQAMQQYQRELVIPQSQLAAAEITPAPRHVTPPPAADPLARVDTREDIPADLFAQELQVDALVEEPAAEEAIVPQAEADAAQPVASDALAPREAGASFVAPRRERWLSWQWGLGLGLLAMLLGSGLGAGFYYVVIMRPAQREAAFAAPDARPQSVVPPPRESASAAVKPAPPAVHPSMKAPSTEEPAPQPKTPGPKRTAAVSSRAAEPKAPGPKRTAAISSRTGQSVAAERPRGNKGFLLVSSTPWGARIFVDGRATGRETPTPVGEPLTLRAGTHKITLVVGKQRFTFPVEIKAGETSKLIKPLPVAP